MPDTTVQADSEVRQIVVLLPLTSQFTRGLLNGICIYAQSVHWYLRHATVTAESIEMIRRTRPHGIITMAGTAFVRRLMRFDIPLVNCGSSARISNLPTVHVDNQAVGRMAASYFHNRGFEHYAFCGRYANRPLLARMARGEAFERAIADYGLCCHRYMIWQPNAEIALTPRDAAELRRWLIELPHPIAIFCCDDLVALQVVAACTEAGLKVPDDVAVLGVDNDEIVCQLASAPISSVSLPHTEIGYHGAALLDRLLDPSREHDKHREQVFPPTEVVTRASTDIIAVQDQDVADALRFIHTHGNEPISVSDVALATDVSRRLLETKFRRNLRRTILSEIRSAHVREARRLLRETDWKMDRVAMASGFNSRDRLTAVFREQMGHTPNEYRNQHIRLHSEERRNDENVRAQ